MMVAVLRARQLLAGINGPGDAEMEDRGSDIGEERDPHNEDGCTLDEHLCMESLDHDLDAGPPIPGDGQ